MKFEEKYKNAKYMEIIKEYSLLVSEEPKPCIMCGEETRFINFCVENRICSEECNIELGEWLNQHCNLAEDY